MKLRKILVAGLLVIGSYTFAQTEQNWVDGELLVQLNDENAIDQLEKDFQEMQLQSVKLVSKHMRIWKFEYNHDLMGIDQAIQRLYSSNDVVIVQRNHILKSRLVPDDPEFDDQWQYLQGSDADIDADLAWDVTTGGTTPDDREIVVCVIDDGVNFDHPDLIPNLWTNGDEIPGNGIDDDGNNFVDDVLGWNAYDDNDNPEHSASWEGHGSAVAGIVGAKGNNGIGVTGVNWDVKLMIVKGGGNEAEALAAYSYPLENRKLYNETNGEKGAFVVATNASWGVDFGMAADAPLWCDFYDTLGVYGVLNAGATINGNQNVDVVGDLPTQCSSEFLIAVTNTNISDNKETFAGFGVESIDLGAPGAGTWTVAQFSNGYDSFGGTSGATPHVAGTIALLYSAPCMAFAELAKTNPRGAALQVREYILNGVDSNTSLDGITVTGGRLNVNNAVQNLMADCPALASVIENENALNQVKLYPNPLSGNIVNVSYSSNVVDNGTIRITDLSGKVILNETISIVNGENFITLELPELAKGMYNLSILSNQATTTLKFTK